MSRHRIGRVVALCASAALLASLAVAAPTAAAEPTCRGIEATISGTPGDDTLIGTNGRDVIAAGPGDDTILGLGGNDLICGGLGDDVIAGNQGRDRIFGNAGADRVVGGKGPDRLFGGVGDDLLLGRKGNDLLVGGPGTDTCLQHQGTGTEVGCELPAKPKAKPEPKDLAVAYSNLDGVAGYQVGGKDVLIAKLVDSNMDGVPSKGDSIVYGKYPTKMYPGAPYAAWGRDKSLEVTGFVDGGVSPDGTGIGVESSAGWHLWVYDPTEYEFYEEESSTNGVSRAVAPPSSKLLDYLPDDCCMEDKIDVNIGSPGLPPDSAYNDNCQPGSQDFLDVDLNAKVTY